MLTIFSASHSKPKNWSVLDLPPLKPFQVLDVSFIRVSEEELTYVRHMFTTYPTPGIPRGKDIYIFGSLAQTIVANLGRQTT